MSVNAVIDPAEPIATVRHITAGDAATLRTAYAEKPSDYYTGVRRDFIDRLPRDGSARVLEIGCGNGATGGVAKAEGRASYYAGVELMPGPAADARGMLDDVLVGNVETLDLPWLDGSFDALFMSEVLEHLIEPWTVVKRLSAKLRSGAIVCASSPNIAHRRVILELLRGRFELADSGVFDRTHMRWFTPASYAAMFEAAGLGVERVRPLRPLSRKERAVSWLTRGQLDHLFMTQIVVEARKP